MPVPSKTKLSLRDLIWDIPRGDSLLITDREWPVVRSTVSQVHRIAELHKDRRRYRVTKVEGGSLVEHVA